MITQDYETALRVAKLIISEGQDTMPRPRLQNEIDAAVTYAAAAVVNMRYLLDRADKKRSTGMAGPDRHRVEPEERLELINRLTEAVDQFYK